jgi:PAS domain S-box-containing protein
MVSAENEPPRNRNRTRRRTVARVATQVGLIGALLAVALMGVQVYRQIDIIRAAPQDDVRWSVTQLEVDIISLAGALDRATAAIALAQGDAQADSVAQDLAHVRTRFDILWSRVDILATGRAFTELRRVPAVHETLSALRRYLRDGVDAVDGSDAALAARLPWLSDEITTAGEGARRAAVEGVRAFATISDRQRLEFTRLLQTTALAVLGLIVALAATLIVLRRASQFSAARGRETAQSRQRFAAAINASLDAIVVADARGRILVWNHAAEQVFGYSRSTAIGADMAELIVPPSLRVFHRRGMERYLETGERRMIGSGRQETRGLRADGVETPIEVSIAAAQGEDGPIFTAYIRDISDRIEADRADLGYDIDGVVYLSYAYGGEMPTPGDLVEVEIQQATEYDLAGVVIPTEPIDLTAGSLDLSLR